MLTETKIVLQKKNEVKMKVDWSTCRNGKNLRLLPYLRRVSIYFLYTPYDKMKVPKRKKKR